MNIENVNIDNITEEELNSIYAYLDMEFESMNASDKLIWIKIIEIVDKKFKEDDYSDSE